MARRSSLASAVALVLTITLVPPGPGPAAAPEGRSEAPVGRSEAPVGRSEGQVTFAVTVTLAPTWFDPAETPGVITPFLTLYALHDALVKPMPGNAFAPNRGRPRRTASRMSFSCARTSSSTTATRSPPRT